MAGMDYGVIVVRNKELDEKLSGCGRDYRIGGLEFYKNHVEFPNGFLLSFEETLSWTNKKVLHWKYRGVKFKTKNLKNQIYVTSFKWFGYFYHVISGYDVDTLDGSFHDKETKRIIGKELRKITDKSFV